MHELVTVRNVTGVDTARDWPQSGNSLESITVTTTMWRLSKLTARWRRRHVSDMKYVDTQPSFSLLIVS